MSHVPSFAVRRIAADDLGLFHQLLTMFGQAFNEMDTYTAKRPRDHYVRDLLGSDEFIALVALREDMVIGGLAAYVLRKFEQERSEIYIYDLAVAQQHRRRGVATGLIENLKSIAKSRGAYVVFVQADLGDEPAIALYSKFGRREDVLHFDLDLC